MPNQIEAKTTRTVYYYTPPDFALENLRNCQIKISRFGDVNDPFELEAISFSNKGFRKRYKIWRENEVFNVQGFLSFSRSWQVSVMWSHYADKHQGFCFQFEAKPDNFFDIRYSQERVFQGITNKSFFKDVGEEQLEDLFGTKHTHWAYEEEARLLVKIENETPEKSGHYFFGFGNDIKLTAVYLGPECNIGIGDVKNAVDDPDVEIIPTRRSFKHFKVVRQKDKTLWNHDGKAK